MNFRFRSIFVILILISIFWMWWLSGPRVSTDCSLTSQAILKSFFDLPQTWSVKGTEGLGEYTIFTLWSWPFSFILGLFANLGFSFEVLERILIVIPFLLIGVFSVNKLCKQYNLSSSAKFVATLFYLANTYILLVIDGGQFTIVLAYAIFPLAYLAIEESVFGGYKKRILAGLLISIISIFDIRFVYVLLLISLIRFFYEFIFLNFSKWKEWILNWLKLGLTSGLILIGVNFYWVLTLFKVPLSGKTFAYLTQTSFTSFISMGHALFLLSPHWYKNVFGNITPLHFEFILIPLLVFLVLILKKRNQSVGFWLLVSMIAIFLTKGTSEPFPNFYSWLYSNIPGFSLFRDSSKFFFLVALSYTVLIGIAVDEITKRVRSPNIKLLFVSSLIVYLLFLIRPVILGQMFGTFSFPPFQKQYSQLNKILENSSPSNVFWIPTISPLTSLDSTHPALEAARLAQKRPFVAATVGTYETFNYLREALYMGQLFDVANIGYIVYPFLDKRKVEDADKIKYYDTFLKQLSNLPWLDRIKDSEIPLLKVKQHQDKFFIAPRSWLVVGSDDIYKQATRSANLSLSKNALIFTEEFANLGKRIDELPNSRIILNKKSSLDLAALFIDKENIIFPAEQLKHDPDKSGWWKREMTDLLSWRSFLQSKYGIDNQDFDIGGGWAIGEGKLKLKINDKRIKKEKILLSRAMESSRAGEVSFYQGDTFIGKLNTRSLEANVKWSEVGKLSSDDELSVTTDGDINVINALAIISEADWQKYKKRAVSYQNRLTNFDYNEAEEKPAVVRYDQISPTKYKISISGLQKPSLLVFAQNFDSNWKLNKLSPFPIYSLLNGYSVTNNGEFELDFEPQKYIPFGMVISVLTLVTSLILLLV